MKIKQLKDCNALNPRLEEVLTLINVKRPLIEYEVTEKSMITNDAISVVAWQDGQKLGEIHSRYSKYSPSKNTNEIWFAVTADSIVKERGRSRHTKFCKDAKGAARVAIEAFVKKPLAVLGVNLSAKVKQMIEDLHASLDYAYLTAFSHSQRTLVEYFTDMHQGKNPPLPRYIVDQIVSKDVLRKRENKEIADNILNHSKSNNGYCIQVMQDETLLWTHMGNSSTTTKAKSTYEFDQYTQEKYTMLKLLDPKQFAADIGVKYEYDDGINKSMIYFVVAGQTKVM